MTLDKLPERHDPGRGRATGPSVGPGARRRRPCRPGCRARSYSNSTRVPSPGPAASSGGSATAPGVETSHRRRSRIRPRPAAALPDPGVQIQHPGGLDREVRVPREDPRSVPPRLDGIGVQASAAPSTAEIAATSPRRRLAPASSAELHRDSGTSRWAGGSHAIALTPATTNGTADPTRGRSTSPAIPSSQNRFRHRHHIDMHTEPVGDDDIRQPVRGQQHDLRPHHPRAQRVGARTPLQLTPLRIRQHDHERRATRHRQPPTGDHPNPVPPAPQPTYTAVILSRQH